MMLIAIAITYLNYQHAIKCSESSIESSDKDMKEFLDSLTKRLLEAESQNLYNSLLTDKIIERLRARIFTMEDHDLNEIRGISEEEAVKIALKLATQPLPKMPSYSIKTDVSGDAEALADLVDGILSKVVDADDDDDEEQSSRGTGGGEVAAQNAYFAEGEAESARIGNRDRRGDDIGTLTDAEAAAMCTQWYEKYQVVVGVSWGSLPFELQERWVVNNCDYHLNAAHAL